MIAHSVSRRSAHRAVAPQIESTVYIAGTDAKVIKCKANKAFVVGNSRVAEGETFFLVKSERRENRYYVVRFNSERNTYQCSCGANCCDHEHLKTVRDYVMSHVVVPAKVEQAKVSSATVAVTEMTAPATVAQVKESKVIKEAREIIAKHDGGPWTPEEYKVIAKADKARQKAWQDEYRQKAQALREEVAR